MVDFQNEDGPLKAWVLTIVYFGPPPWIWSICAIWKMMVLTELLRHTPVDLDTGLYASKSILAAGVL